MGIITGAFLRSSLLRFLERLPGTDLREVRLRSGRSPSCAPYFDRVVWLGVWLLLDLPWPRLDAAAEVDGIPLTSFAVDDVYAEYERLRTDGVVFTQPPVAMGSVTTAVLDDTCGNLIQLAQKG
jgi:hypothetical protein